MDFAGGHPDRPAARAGAQRLQPVVQVVASFPAPMLFPWVVGDLAILSHPVHDRMRFAAALLGTQWYVLFNVIAGAMAIPSDLREAARVYHLGRWFTWRKLYIPAVFPYLVTGTADRRRRGVERHHRRGIFLDGRERTGNLRAGRDDREGHQPGKLSRCWPPARSPWRCSL